MGKKSLRIFVLFFLMIFLISGVSAIRINEVEMNPIGTDSGNEWVEFYSNIEISLNNYKIVNNDGGEILLNGSFTGHYIYIFQSQWLDNTDEKIFLYESSNLIDETNLLVDSDNDGNTWQFCDGSWEFLSDTKNAENGCTYQEPPKEEHSSSLPDIQGTPVVEEIIEEPPKDDNQINEISHEVQGSDEVTGFVSMDTIDLNPKVIKTKDAEEYNLYAVFGLVVFSALLAFLFIIRWVVTGKNEFD